MARDAAFGAGREQIFQPYIGEGAAYHDLIVAAPRTERVEVLDRHAATGEILSRRSLRLDRTGRRDVIRRDAIAQQRENTRALDVAYRLRLRLHIREVGRIFDVG